MALLEDPTIQRILDEVNKAASGGVFGLAGNYIPEPTKSMTQNQTTKNDYFNQQQQQQQQTQLFYPTADMYNLDGITNFEQNLDLNSMDSMLPIATPNNFDIYTTGLYNTMPQSLLSPYENYKNDMLNNTDPIRPTSTVSSTNNDILLDHHRHQEYPTIPPKIPLVKPNLGLNLRSTPPLDTIPGNIDETNDETLPNETTDTATASIDLLVDKDDNNSLPPNNNEEIDPPHICT
jgi:hypothetical protein